MNNKQGIGSAKYGYGYSCNEINPLLQEQQHKFCPLVSYRTCPYPHCIAVVTRRGGECALQHNNNNNNNDYNSAVQHLPFVLNESFQITLNLGDDKTLILHEHRHGVRFVLTKRSYHSWISFNRIDSSSGSQNMNIDIEASILFPPGWEIDDEIREIYASPGIAEIDDEIREIYASPGINASSDEEIIEIMQNLANNGDEEMRDRLAQLHPRWIPIKIDSFTMNTGDDNEVEAHLLQLPHRSNTDDYYVPFNIDISIKQK